jgi:hypothetical protein
MRELNKLGAHGYSDSSNAPNHTQAPSKFRSKVTSQTNSRTSVLATIFFGHHNVTQLSNRR